MIIIYSVVIFLCGIRSQLHAHINACFHTALCFFSLPFKYYINAVRLERCYTNKSAWPKTKLTFLVFTSSTGRSPRVPETTRKTLTAVGSQTAATTAERLLKSPASLLGTYEYTQVSEKHRKKGYEALRLHRTPMRRRG